MKRINLLIIFTCLTTLTFSQLRSIQTNSSLQQKPNVPFESVGQFYVDGMKISEVLTSKQKKYRALPFAADDFSSGTASTLPNGWTTGGSTASSVWVWKNGAFPGSYGIGVIQSPTATNGWLGYNGDVIGSTITGAYDGWVEKTFNCSGHSTVALTFQTFFRKFDDSCMVEVSNNGGSSWSSYWIYETNSLPYNNLTKNPTPIFLDITSTAANQSAVVIRFHYYNSASAGIAFNWLIDDLALSELDPVDVRIRESGFSCQGSLGMYSYRLIPLSLQDSVRPFTFFSNLGSSSLFNTTVTANLMKAGTNVGTGSIVHPSMPAGTMNSGLYTTGKIPVSGMGDYKIDLNLNLAGDANSSNNIDSVKFGISDSVYSLNDGVIIENYVVHRKPVGAGSELKFIIADLFEVPFTDTLTHCYVSFSFNSQAGGQVMAGLYKFDPGSSSWIHVMNSATKTLTTADLSTTSTIKFARLTFSDTASWANVLAPGHYAIGIEAVNPTITSQDMYINSSQDKDIVHQYGAYSVHSGTNSFGVGALPFGTTSTPLITASFSHGTPASSIGLNDYQTSGFRLIPNPASTYLSVFQTGNSKTEDIGLKLFNLTGQVVKTCLFSDKPLTNSRANCVYVGDIPRGIYFYTLTIGNEKKSGKIVLE